MALNELQYEFKVDNPTTILKENYHYGVVGSGDMEVLMEKKDLGGAVKVKVVTPVSGFDKVWERVLKKFVTENSMGDVSLEINDNNATPVVVTMRLRQALAELVKEAEGGDK